MTLKNQKRSGGPTSPEGKLIASQNSLQTGAYSSLAVLPTENQEEFNQLLDHFNHDFQPADMVETALVRDLAILTWKKLRLEKLENDYFIKKSNVPITLEELIDCGLKFNATRYEFWVKQGSFDEKTLVKARSALNYIRPIVHSAITTSQLQEVKKLNSLIYDNIIAFYHASMPFAVDQIADADLVAKSVLYEDQPKRLITTIVLGKFVEFYEAGFWCTERKSKIDEAVLQIKQERTLKIMQSDSTRRANDDLSRSFMRTLSEYRKHHQWRMQNRVIDVEDK